MQPCSESPSFSAASASRCGVSKHHHRSTHHRLQFTADRDRNSVSVAQMQHLHTPKSRQFRCPPLLTVPSTSYGAPTSYGATHFSRCHPLLTVPSTSYGATHFLRCHPLLTVPPTSHGATHFSRCPPLLRAMQVRLSVNITAILGKSRSHGSLISMILVNPLLQERATVPILRGDVKMQQIKGFTAVLSSIR